MDTLIRLQGLKKIYRTDDIETHALQGLDVQIRRGEYLAVSGPSGCGKSTLLALLGLLDTASEGRYELKGRDVTALNARERAEVRNAEIGFVFQSFNLVDDLNVFDNVALPLRYRSGRTPDLRERVMAALEQVQLTHRARHRPAQLSGGQQQRVAIARALVGTPSLLLVDEPTGNLDSHNAEAVMELLKQMHGNGTTIVMVTHEERFAREASRRLHMLDGRILGEEHRDVRSATASSARSADAGSPLGVPA